MILLDTTTRSLEIDLTGAVATNQLPFVACYVDINQSTFAMSAASTNTGTSNSTTAVTLVSAPGATTTRQLKYLSVKNSDTASVELWIQLNDNSTLREIWKGTLAVGDTLEYIDSNGWKVLNSSGQIKSTFSGSWTSTRVPFGGSDGNLTTDSGFTFSTTGDVLTVGAINVAGTTAPTSGWYLPSADLIRTPNSVTIDDQLVVSGTGPHAIGAASLNYAKIRVGGAFTSGGASVVGAGLLYDGSLTGASGDTAWLAAVGLVPAGITTQGAAEAIGVVATLYVDEPIITIGTATVTAASTVYIARAPTEGTNNYALWVDAGTTRLDGDLLINDTANANMTVGVTINQGANDNEILAFKSSDVAHGVTAVSETDTYGMVKKFDAANGGTQMWAFSASTQAWNIRGVHTTDDTTDTTASVGVFTFNGFLKSGTGGGAQGANANLIAFQSNSATRMLLKGDDGELHLGNTTLVALDDHDDLDLIAKAEEFRTEGQKMDFQTMKAQTGYDKLVEIGLVGRITEEEWNRGDRPLVSMQRLVQLAYGEARQKQAKLDSLMEVMEEKDPGFRAAYNAKIAGKGLAHLRR